jgi:hypothetical protein
LKNGCYGMTLNTEYKIDENWLVWYDMTRCG